MIGTRIEEDGGNRVSARTGTLVRKWLRLSWSDRLLLGEAVAALAVASLAIAILRFRTIALIAGWIAGEEVPEPEYRRSLARRVRWAVKACSNRVPWRAVCFQQGLAAQWMLRRRGVASTLYYGATPDAVTGLATHVWVRDGNTDVIGCEIADKFAVLAAFPPLKP